jgi:hypothetical protein
MRENRRILQKSGAFLDLDLCRQNRRKPERCHLRMVSGWTTTMAFLARGDRPGA